MRSVVATVLVVVACVLAPFAVCAVWVHRTVFDTDGYVRAVTPVGRDQAVRDAVADRAVAAIERAYATVPTGARARCGSVSPARRSRSCTGRSSPRPERVVDSPRFEDVWVRANRTGHAARAALVHG